MKNSKKSKKSKKFRKIERGSPFDFRFFNFWICIVRRAIYDIEHSIYSRTTSRFLKRVKSIEINKVDHLFKMVISLINKVNHHSLVKSLPKHVIEIFPNPLRKSISKIESNRSLDCMVKQVLSDLVRLRQIALIEQPYANQ